MLYLPIKRKKDQIEPGEDNYDPFDRTVDGIIYFINKLIFIKYDCDFVLNII
jgi:hypothetical protein